MGSLSKIRTVATALRNRAFGAIPQKARRIPEVFRSQFQQAQKRNIRRLTHQVVPIRAMHTKRIRPPIPGLYRPEIGQPSPNFGKLLPDYPKFKNFMQYRPRRPAARQLFRTPLWNYNERAKTFLATRQKAPFTTLSRHEGAGLVGARSPIANREAL